MSLLIWPILLLALCAFDGPGNVDRFGVPVIWVGPNPSHFSALELSQDRHFRDSLDGSLGLPRRRVRQFKGDLIAFFNGVADHHRKAQLGGQEWTRRQIPEVSFGYRSPINAGHKATTLGDRGEIFRQAVGRKTDGEIFQRFGSRSQSHGFQFSSAGVCAAVGASRSESTGILGRFRNPHRNRVGPTTRYPQVSFHRDLIGTRRQQGYCSKPDRFISAGLRCIAVKGLTLIPALTGSVGSFSIPKITALSAAWGRIQSVQPIKKEVFR